MTTAERVAARTLRATFFEVGDRVTYGKYQNKPGKIVKFTDDGKGNPLVVVEPIPKGKKKNKTFALFKIRHPKKTATLVMDRYLMQDWSVLTRRVAARYLTAVDDMQAMLLKLRKGVTTPIESIGKLKKILDHLGGWNVEPFVGAVHVLYVGRGSGPPEEMAELYAIQKKHEVKSLPVSPRVDEVYVMAVAEPAPLHTGSPQYGVHCEVWVGAAGFKITSPEGKTFEALPSKGAWDKGNLNGDLRKLPKIGPKPLAKYIGFHRYESWIMHETNFKQQVLEALGMDEHKKAAPRTQENTGSCPCCFRNIKLKWSGPSPTMVNHGFKRPGWGRQEGNCMGVGFPPFEVSPNGTQHLVDRLVEQRDQIQDKLDSIETIDVLVVVPGDIRSLVKREDPRWDKAVGTYLKNAPRFVKWLDDDIKRLGKMIAEWQEQPLPKGGVEVRDWQFKPR